MKKLLLGVMVLGIIGGFLYWSASSGVLGDEYVLVTYSSPIATTTYGTFYVGFIKETDDKMNAWIDLDADGTFTDSEKVVSDFPLHSRAEWRIGFGVKFAGGLPPSPRIKIELDGGDNVEATLLVTDASGAEDMLELEKVTKPNLSMKWGGDVAYAHETAETAARPGNVPDLSQRIAECAPTAAANSIISLAEEHGVPLSELPTPTDIVDGLKGEMDWTPADGVVPDGFIEGKNRWSVTHGLPIKTELAGGEDGRGTLDEIRDALQNGKAAEIRIHFSNDNGGGEGGHMATVVRVREVGGETFIDLNDPNTPAGTESYKVNLGEIEGYPSEWHASIGWGFVQTWEGTFTGTALEPMTDAEVSGIRAAVGAKEKIKVIVYGGKHIPVSLVHLGTGPECKKGEKEMPHWHANQGATIKATDGTIVPDPAPGGCGYGMAINVPVIDAVVE